SIGYWFHQSSLIDEQCSLLARNCCLTQRRKERKGSFAQEGRVWWLRVRLNAVSFGNDSEDQRRSWLLNDQ
ncbi:MAG: hypothetical protein JXL84_22025, partial [Deltaproteobacteria bacterium]|nr:hypothetical protein [Deltaproteobacteria bacterium]